MISREEVSELCEILEVLIERFKHLHGSCLYMSSLLAACINDHTDMNAEVVTGSLKVADKTVFSDTPILPVLNNAKGNVFDIWDGHSWVQVSGLILDPSIFRTIYSTATPESVAKLFVQRFGNNQNYLIGQSHKLKEIDVVYTAKERFENKHIDMLIKSADAMGAISS